MTDFDQEMQRDLNGLVNMSYNTDWVNPEDKADQQITADFRATPISQSDAEDEVSESVDGLPVKDRDLVDSNVERRVLGQELDENESKIEEGGEVVRGNLEDSDTVPDATVKKVTEWVGDDKDRAQRALDVENQKENPRKSLVENLEEVLGE